MNLEWLCVGSRDGTAAGVPYLADSPQRADRIAPLVLLWHGFDHPRREQAMRKALALF